MLDTGSELRCERSDMANLIVTSSKEIKDSGALSWKAQLGEKKTRWWKVKYLWIKGLRKKYIPATVFSLSYKWTGPKAFYISMETLGVNTLRRPMHSQLHVV